MSDYKSFGLVNDPWKVFNDWHTDALKKEENANAFALATVDLQGSADVRFILYKGVKENGLSFFSHTDSPKGRHLEENCSAAMAFYWHKSERQVRVRGRVALLDLEVSREYFRGRDKDSKLASMASSQSATIATRAEFQEKMKSLEAQFGEKLEAPDHWRAYTLIPEEWEFFIYGAHRINDRFLYKKNESGWTIKRLQP